MSETQKKTEEETVITDEMGNEFVEGMVVTIPADIAEENGAFEDDAHDLDDDLKEKLGGGE